VAEPCPRRFPNDCKSHEVLWEATELIIRSYFSSKRTLLYGEIVALDKDGLPRFDALRSRRTGVAIVFYAFDLLYLEGFNLTACTLVQRKALLRSILPKDNTGRVRFTDHISGSGERLFEKIELLQLEGMVMKRKASVYAFMRSRDWLKVRTSILDSA
jgi:bifunctional non-homologous end joining protein LigD